MSVETEGALNRLTAAALAIATAIEQQQANCSYADARENVQYSFEQHLNFILSSGDDD